VTDAIRPPSIATSPPITPDGVTIRSHRRRTVR